MLKKTNYLVGAWDVEPHNQAPSPHQLHPSRPWASRWFICLLSPVLPEVCFFLMFKLSFKVLEDKDLACPSLPSSLSPSFPLSFLHPSFPFSPFPPSLPFLLPSLLPSPLPSINPFLVPILLSFLSSWSIFADSHLIWRIESNSWFEAWTWWMKAWPLSLTCTPGWASASSSCLPLPPSVLPLILGPIWEQLWSQESMLNSYGWTFLACYFTSLTSLFSCIKWK